MDLSLLDNVIIKLASGLRLDKKHRDLEPSDKYKGFRECHIKPDWLLIYLIDNGVLTLTLATTGSHSDLLGMRQTKRAKQSS